MPRYFFHVRHGQVLYRDPDGIELADDSAARAHAIDDAEDLRRMDSLDAPTEEFTIEVSDVEGRISLSVPFITLAGARSAH